MIHQPHPGIRRPNLLQSTEEIELFLFGVPPSGRQPAVRAPASGHSAVTKGFQLCGVGRGTEGPRVPPCTQRSHCCNPRRLSEPAATAPCCTLVGNFEQTSSKAGRVPLRNTRGSVNVPPPGTVYWATLLYVTLWPLEQGASCTTGDCFVCLFGPGLPIQRNTQTTRLMTG